MPVSAEASAAAGLAAAGWAAEGKLRTHSGDARSPAFIFFQGLRTTLHACTLARDRSHTFQAFYRYVINCYLCFVTQNSHSSVFV
jgi:hypothetical protein